MSKTTKKPHKLAKKRAKVAQDQEKTVNKVALESEKENDDAQKEVQELQRVMEPKRARTQSVTTDDNEECEKQSWEDWDLPDSSGGASATRIRGP